ncbi:MAG TPA: hypothetical protein VGU23_02905, partial [Acidobacteriaceae bacterium]|nr:hypothetical protein [Acidobacteriaceae bacterium]
MRQANLTFLLFLGLFSASLAAQQPCATSAAAAQVHAAQADLLRQPTQEMATEVEPLLQTRIKTFKTALLNAVDAAMQCVGATADAATIQQTLDNVLVANQSRQAGTPAGQLAKEEPDTYGGALKMTVSTPASATSLRAVELSYGISCGSDHMLLMYAANSGGWQRAFVWQSEIYADISKAFGDWLSYTVIPSSSLGAIKVAVAHGTAWCTSNISGAGIDVLAPVQGKAAPRLVWHHDEGYRRETDPRMLARPDGFELRLDVSTIELEQVIRKGVFRYRVEGDSVMRVQPIAIDGRGFVDVWLQAPWSDAQRWSVAEGLPTFAKVHEQ